MFKVLLTWDANLTKEQIHRVEVVGGATRILKVKQTALEFFGRKQLDGSLNGDEAAALGATLYAAKMSTSFRLREFAINDVHPHAASIRVTGQGVAGADGTEGETGKKGTPKLLFKANSKMPHKKLISMTRVDDLLAALAVAINLVVVGGASACASCSAALCTRCKIATGDWPKQAAWSDMPMQLGPSSRCSALHALSLFC